jgi:homoserine kinase
MTASAMNGSAVITATCGQNINWRLMLALPGLSLSTSKARAMLPETYSRADVIANVQNTALLVAAFALDRPDLLKTAMSDRLHQPYRQQACPLLPLLMPLTKEVGFFGISLSGAGPSVLLIADPSIFSGNFYAAIRGAAGDENLEVIETTVASRAKVMLITKSIME